MWFNGASAIAEQTTIVILGARDPSTRMIDMGAEPVELSILIELSRLPRFIFTRGVDFVFADEWVSDIEHQFKFIRGPTYFDG